LAKASAKVPLELRKDGTFLRQVTEGRWDVVKDEVRCEPLTFGGETLDAMRSRAEGMGRAFGLAFVFDPFVLRIVEHGLETPEDGNPIFTAFRQIED
jgi:hypothetical protein